MFGQWRFDIELSGKLVASTESLLPSYLLAHCLHRRVSIPDLG